VRFFESGTIFTGRLLQPSDGAGASSACMRWCRRGTETQQATAIKRQK
jgi:hypothetical protein